MNQENGGNIQAVSDAAKAEESTVPNAVELIGFADAAITRNEELMPETRKALLQAVGAEGLVDAAGVVGNFERMNRIADAGGLEVDAPVRVLSANVRDELGLDGLASAARAKRVGAFGKIFARIAMPIALRFFGRPNS